MKWPRDDMTCHRQKTVMFQNQREIREIRERVVTMAMTTSTLAYRPSEAGAEAAWAVPPDAKAVVDRTWPWPGYNYCVPGAILYAKYSRTPADGGEDRQVSRIEVPPQTTTTARDQK